MVILIGGVSNTGKTLLAHHLMVRYGITYISIDHIKMGLFRGDPNCGFTPLDDSLELGERLWPIIKGIIMTNIENRQNIILEGCYLLPHLMSNFEKTYSDQILPIFLGFSEEYIRENHTTEIALNVNAAEDKDKCDDLEIMLSDHHRMRTACIENNSNYFEVTSDYRSEMKAVFQFVEEQLSERKDTLKTVDTYC
jgi:2-phosphoglycerate kinase